MSQALEGAPHKGHAKVGLRGKRQVDVKVAGLDSGSTTQGEQQPQGRLEEFIVLLGVQICQDSGFHTTREGRRERMVHSAHPRESQGDRVPVPLPVDGIAAPGRCSPSRRPLGGIFI